MTDDPDVTRIERRAQLSPEEAAAGSDDPMRQAEVILEDSDKRTDDGEPPERNSVQTPN